jgi:hypothetical protein
MPTVPAAPPDTPSRLRQLAAGTAAGLLLAVVGNLVVYLIGDAGAPIRVVSGWAPDGADLTIGEIVTTTVVAIVAGSALLAIVERFRQAGFRQAGFRPWAWLTAGLAVLSSIPLWRLDIDTGSHIGLTAMHLWTGAACIAGHLFQQPAAVPPANRARPATLS